MYKVYAIQSEKDNRIYVGLTDSLEVRLKYHNSGQVFSTKGFRPWHIIYTEDCVDRPEARQREKYLKSGCGKEFLKSYVRE
jgi:putative endonuclease